jgi:hypothetical protein
MSTSVYDHAVMDEVIEFLRRYAEAEYRVGQANFIEPDDKAFFQQVFALDDMFTGGLRSGMSRPHGSPPEDYASVDNIEAAERLQPRSIFAIAHYRTDDVDVYRAWMGDTELGPRGEGMIENLFAVRDDDGELKISSVYLLCGNCHGRGVDDGKPCGRCGTIGWEFRRGTEWMGLGHALEVRKLKEPSDPLSQPVYRAIETT